MPTDPPEQTADRTDRLCHHRLVGEEAVEVLGEGGRGGIPPGRFLLDRLQEDRLQIAVERRVEAAGRDRILGGDLPEELRRTLTRKGPSERHQLVEHQAQGVYVGLGGQRPSVAVELLRGHVRRGAQELPAERQSLPLHQPDQAEIEEAGPPIEPQEEVGGLHIPMDDPLLMGVGQGLGHLRHDTAAKACVASCPESLEAFRSHRRFRAPGKALDHIYRSSSVSL